MFKYVTCIGVMESWIRSYCLGQFVCEVLDLIGFALFSCIHEL